MDENAKKNDSISDQNLNGLIPQKMPTAEKIKLGIAVASVAGAGFLFGYFGKGIMSSTEFEIIEKNDQEYFVNNNEELLITKAEEAIILGTTEYAVNSARISVQNSQNKNMHLNNMAMFALQSIDTAYNATLDIAVACAKSAAEKNFYYANSLAESVLKMPLASYTEKNRQLLASSFAGLAVADPELYESLEQKIFSNAPKKSWVNDLKQKSQPIEQTFIGKQEEKYDRETCIKLKSAYNRLAEVITKTLRGK